MSNLLLEIYSVTNLYKPLSLTTRRVIQSKGKIPSFDLFKASYKVLFFFSEST